MSGVFHALAGSHESGSASRASRRSRALACSGVATSLATCGPGPTSSHAPSPQMTCTSRSPLRKLILPEYRPCPLSKWRSWSNSSVEITSALTSSTPSGVRRRSSRPVGFLCSSVREKSPSRSEINRPSAYKRTVNFPGSPMLCAKVKWRMSSPFFGSARRRSYGSQADDALVEDIGAYGEGRGSSDDDHQCHRGKHDELPATTALERGGEPPAALPSPACPCENVLPVARERFWRERGEPCGEQRVFVRAHAITSLAETSSAESSAPSCRCAWDRVAATVPSAIPSTSPISA